MSTRMKPTSSRSTSRPSPARASSFALALVLGLASCASFDGHTLVPGQSTQREVEATMGQPADKRVGPQGETVYWYPQLPYGHASYAAAIATSGYFIAIASRLSEANHA